jgi:hypothetical protein
MASPDSSAVVGTMNSSTADASINLQEGGKKRKSAAVALPSVNNDNNNNEDENHKQERTANGRHKAIREQQQLPMKRTKSTHESRKRPISFFAVKACKGIFEEPIIFFGFNDMKKMLLDDKFLDPHNKFLDPHKDKDSNGINKSFKYKKVESLADALKYVCDCEEEDSGEQRLELEAVPNLPTRTIQAPYNVERHAQDAKATTTATPTATATATTTTLERQMESAAGPTTTTKILHVGVLDDTTQTTFNNNPGNDEDEDFNDDDDNDDDDELERIIAQNFLDESACDKVIAALIKPNEEEQPSTTDKAVTINAERTTTTTIATSTVLQTAKSSATNNATSTTPGTAATPTTATATPTLHDGDENTATTTTCNVQAVTPHPAAQTRNHRGEDAKKSSSSATDDNRKRDTGTNVATAVVGNGRKQNEEIDNNDEPWEEHFKLLCEYKEEFGNCKNHNTI